MTFSNNRNLRQSWRNANAVLLLLIVGVAALLRFLFLTSKSFWTDEGFSVFMAQNDLSSFMQFVRYGEINMVLYYGLLRLWIHGGISEGFIRSFSALASVATVPIMYLIGKRLVGRNVGLVAALLLAVHPTHIAFAQEARSYALEVLLVSLSTLYLLKLSQRGSAVDCAAYVCTAVLAVYSHVLALLIPIAQWPALLFRSQRSDIWRVFFIAVLSSALLLLPLILFVLTNGRDAVNWIPRPAWPDLLVLFRFLTLTHYGFVYALGWLAALWSVLRKPPKGAEESWPVVLLVCWLVLPLVFVLLISLYKPILAPRFLLMCVPAAILLAALGFNSVRRPMNLVLISLTVAASLAGVRSYYRHPQLKEDSRGASEYVFSESRPGDGVSVLPEYGRFVFSYYRQLHRISPAQLPYSALNGDAEGVQRPADRLWVVVYQGQSAGPLGTKGIRPVMAASGTYCPVRSLQFNRIEVWLLQKCR